MTLTTSFSDLFVAVWPTLLAMDLLRYLIAAGILAAVLAVFASSFAKRRIQSREATGQDVRREISYSVSTAFLFSLVGFAVYLGSTQGIFRIYGGDSPGGIRIILEFLAVVLTHDAYFYWAHRAMHNRWLFRRVHRLHHKSRTPTPWTAYAFAPPEAIVEAGILPFAALLIPMHEITVFLFMTHMIARNVVGHAGIELFPGWWLEVPLVRLVTTTTHHDLHHTHGGYNFGLYFTWWDRWMNTEHPEYKSRFMAVAQSRCRIDLSLKENTK